MKITIQICEKIALELDSSMCDDRQLLDDTLKASVEFAEGRISLGELMDVVHRSNEQQDARSEAMHKKLSDALKERGYQVPDHIHPDDMKQIGLEV